MDGIGSRDISVDKRISRDPVVSFLKSEYKNIDRVLRVLQSQSLRGQDLRI